MVNYGLEKHVMECVSNHPLRRRSTHNEDHLADTKQSGIEPGTPVPQTDVLLNHWGIGSGATRCTSRSNK